MAVYQLDYEAENGDLLDLEYFDSWDCLARRLEDLGVPYEAVDSSGQWSFVTARGTRRFVWGRTWASETDYNVYCGTCEDLMWRGLQEGGE